MPPPGLVPSPSRPRLHFADLRGRHVLADDLPAEIHKRFVHISAAAGARFVVWSVSPVLGDGKGARARHGPVFFEIGFVADDDERDGGIVFDAHDLVPQFVKFGKGGEGGDAEDEEEALTGFHV